MTRGFSLHLDLARVLAAFAVLASHLAATQASGNALAGLRALNIGSDAVIVFFVLSGLVIAHTAHAKDRTLGGYALARVSRLWSVALPAIGLSVALVALGWVFAPAAYNALSVDEIANGALRSVLFTNYVWFSGAHLPGNNPYWSVTYEFWCYAGFGAAAFLRGRARLYSLVAIALLAGPRIALLAPCWAAGVWVRAALDARAFDRVTRPLGWALALGPLLTYAALQLAGLPEALTALTTAMLGGHDPNTALGFSDEFLWSWILAALTAAHFLGIAALMREAHRAPAAFERPVRWIAARTFSLYLFHMPILQLATALPAYDASNPGHVVMLTALILAASFGLAELTERRLPRKRTWIARAIADLRGVRALPSR